MSIWKEHQDDFHRRRDLSLNLTPLVGSFVVVVLLLASACSSDLCPEGTREEGAACVPNDAGVMDGGASDSMNGGDVLVDTASQRWCRDGDMDELGDPEDCTGAIEAPAGYVGNADDCDDSDPEITEAPTWYQADSAPGHDEDQDGDAAFDAPSMEACVAPERYVSTNGDCADDDPSRSSLAEEMCNEAASATDDDCDGVIDEGLSSVTSADDLQAAIDDAAVDDILCVSGAHVGAFVIDKNIRVSGDSSARLIGPAVPTGSVVTMSAGILEGLTVTNGGVTRGAGIRVPSGNVLIRRVLIVDNHANLPDQDNFGAGLCVEAGAAVVLEDSSVHSNMITGHEWNYGAGIYTAGQLTMRRVSVRENEVHTLGSAAFSNVIGVGVTVHGATATLNATNVLIVQNESRVGREGGAHLGTGLLVYEGGNAIVTNAVIVGNRAWNDADVLGVGVAVLSLDGDPSSTATFVNVINAFNSTDVDLPETTSVGYFRAGNATIEATHGSTFGNRSLMFAATEDIGVDLDRGNIVVDPMFTDADSGNYRLQATSPCIDAGNSAAAYQDSDGSRADMGAFGGPGGDW